MAVDHAAQAIRVNCVCPGPVDTPMLHGGVPSDAAAEDERVRKRMPLARHAQAEEIAATIAFLLSDDAELSTGSIVSADGGSTAA